MVFNSIDFLIFFPVVLLLYFVIPARIRYIWLLIASYFFYMCWNPVYSILIVISTLATYLGALLIDRARCKGRKRSRRKIRKQRWTMTLVIVLNLGILFYFKYADFLIDTLNELLSPLNVAVISHVNVLLPVGISFYTFQALGYIIDVYRGEIKAEKNLLKYALFVSFFPQLVAGPIERSGNLLTQIREEPEHKLWDYGRVTSGFMTMLWGYFMKVVIADRVGVLTDYVFKNYEMFGTVELSVGAVAFALQIFCDFNGYSTIAVGTAKVLGFDLMDNFDTPYFAQGIAAFWRRWHISLSTWFRDYVYIPLGGSRCSKWKRYRNLMITFVVSGLWHGANWTYVLWGALHGLYQIVEKELTPVVRKINAVCKTRVDSFGYKVCRVVITFAAVDFAWIFFRADNVHQALHYIERMICFRDWWALSNGSMYHLGLDVPELHILAVSVLILFAVEVLRYTKKISFSDWLAKQWIVFRWCVCFAGIFGILIWGYYGRGYDMAPFIYFQF